MSQLIQAKFTQPSTQIASLQAIISHLLRHTLSDLLRNSSSSVINAVPSSLNLPVDEMKASPVIREMLSTIITQAQKSRITIRAERLHDMIILEINDQRAVEYSTPDSIKGRLERLAQEAGGYIRISGAQPGTTISFSFPELSKMQIPGLCH